MIRLGSSHPQWFMPRGRRGIQSSPKAVRLLDRPLFAGDDAGRLVDSTSIHPALRQSVPQVLRAPADQFETIALASLGAPLIGVQQSGHTTREPAATHVLLRFVPRGFRGEWMAELKLKKRTFTGGVALMSPLKRRVPL